MAHRRSARHPQVDQAVLLVMESGPRLLAGSTSQRLKHSNAWTQSRSSNGQKALNSTADYNFACFWCPGKTYQSHSQYGNPFETQVATIMNTWTPWECNPDEHCSPQIERLDLKALYLQNLFQDCLQDPNPTPWV